MFNVALCVLTHRRMLFRVIKPPLKLEVYQGEGRRPLRLCRCLWCSRVTRTHNALFCQSRTCVTRFTISKKTSSFEIGVLMNIGTEIQTEPLRP